MKKKILKTLCTIPVLAVSFSNMVFANAMQNSEIMTKVKQFIQDGTSTLMILTPILGRIDSWDSRYYFYGKW